MSGTAQLITQI